MECLHPSEYEEHMRRIPMVILSFFLFLHLLSSQEDLKIGVVLSGGGAKGYAHIGVLKVLEEAGVRIDYIGGTSMGAIIGGLYAAGYSAEQLDSTLQTREITAIVNDEIPRRFIPYFNRLYGERYFFSAGIEDGEVVFPTAISQGQRVFNLFTELTYPANLERDFDALSIPYSCMVTDIQSGEGHQIRKGFLPLAMRASGSLPALLAPIPYDTLLASDGGIVNNFPVQEVRDMGADYIIGVTVESGLKKRDELRSVTDILTQVSTFQLVRKSKEQYALCDLLIHPKLEDHSMTDFDAVGEIARIGEEAASGLRDTLMALANRQNLPAGQGKEREFESSDSINIATVEIEGNHPFSDELIQGYFDVPLRGCISMQDFENGTLRMMSSGQFQFIDYDFIPQWGGTRIVLKPYVKPGFDRTFRLGLHFDEVYKSAILLNGTLRNFVVPNSTASLDLILGNRVRYYFSWFMDRGKHPSPGITSRLNYNDITFDLPFDVPNNDSSIHVNNLDFRYTDYAHEAYIRLLSGYNFHLNLVGRYNDFRIATDQFSLSEEDERFEYENGKFISGEISLQHDNTDHLDFPMSGWIGKGQLRTTYTLESKLERISEFSYNIDGQLETYIPLTDKWSLGLAAAAGINSEHPPFPNLYFLGSNNKNLINNFRSLQGLEFAHIIGEYLLKGSVMLRINHLRNHYLTIRANAAQTNDYLSSNQQEAHRFASAAISYGLSTPIGPLELTFAQSNEKALVHFALGYWF